MATARVELLGGLVANNIAALMALIANCHRDPKRGRPFTAADFLPKSGGGGQDVVIPATFDMLRRAIFGGTTECQPSSDTSCNSSTPHA